MPLITETVALIQNRDGRWRWFLRHTWTELNPEIRPRRCSGLAPSPPIQRSPFASGGRPPQHAAKESALGHPDVAKRSLWLTLCGICLHSSTFFWHFN